MSSITKNTKGNRKVVRATYNIEKVFKIPNNLDLEDESVVEYWGVKWGTLYIKYVGQEDVERIEDCFESEPDYKYATDEEIVDADERRGQIFASPN